MNVVSLSWTEEWEREKKNKLLAHVLAVAVAMVFQCQLECIHSFIRTFEKSQLTIFLSFDSLYPVS